MRELIAYSFYGESHTEPPLIANPASLVPQAISTLFTFRYQRLRKFLCVLTYRKIKICSTDCNAVAPPPSASRGASFTVPPVVRRGLREGWLAAGYSDPRWSAVFF